MIRKSIQNACRNWLEAASEVGIGTKAQQALKLQLEERKLERKKSSREQREAEKQNNLNSDKETSRNTEGINFPCVFLYQNLERN